MQYFFFFFSCLCGFTATVWIGPDSKYWSAAALACLFGGVLFTWFDEHMQMLALLRNTDCRTCPFKAGSLQDLMEEKCGVCQYKDKDNGHSGT